MFEWLCQAFSVYIVREKSLFNAGVDFFLCVCFVQYAYSLVFLVLVEIAAGVVAFLYQDDVRIVGVKKAFW